MYVRAVREEPIGTFNECVASKDSGGMSNSSASQPGVLLRMKIIFL